MSFSRQVRWALTRGAAMVALGVALAFVTMLFRQWGWHPWQHLPAFAAMDMMAVGGMVILAAGLARPLQRGAFLRGGMPSGRLRGFALNQPLLRRWYWVDQAGNSRDG